MSGAVNKLLSMRYVTRIILFLLGGVLMSAVLANSPFSPFKHARRLSSNHTPAINIWAWERDEDLSFIDPAKVSVSYFAGMIYVRGSSVSFRPRTQKLKLAKGTQTVPVFRIESLRGEGMPGSVSTSDARMPDMSAATYVAKTIVSRMKELPPSNVVQLDFDALEDERPFYTAILKQLRRELPANSKISITALGSWLLSDRWLEDGDADEAVAMLFSIGADKKNILDRIQKQDLDSGTNAELALGISASEPDTNRVLFRAHLQNKFDKLYIFNSRPWTQDRLLAITKEAFQK
ncbi:MAG: DUF3142 domain-containing protein [Cyanobacteria bacterium SZAS-4]|nr:DUF3142 domain-containing protein [Cyanobacteria bacterium SZAS-4]